MIKFRLALVLSVYLFCIVANAASIVYSGDTVVGVSGLEFLDSAYDATFYDGSYDDLLTAYPMPPNETDYDNAFATTANSSLYDFVITDAFSGIAPDAINGCTRLTQCFMATAVGQSSLTTAYVEYWGNSLAAAGFSNGFALPDDNYANVSWIVWQESGAPPQVPVPPAVWLFSSALGLLAWTRSRLK